MHGAAHNAARVTASAEERESSTTGSRIALRRFAFHCIVGPKAYSTMTQTFQQYPVLPKASKTEFLHPASCRGPLWGA